MTAQVESSSFIKALEEEFEDRYTENDEDYKRVLDRTVTDPPVVVNWNRPDRNRQDRYNRRGNDRRYNDRNQDGPPRERVNYRDRERDDGYENRNTYNRRYDNRGPSWGRYDNRDYNRGSYRQGYSHSDGRNRHDRERSGGRHYNEE